VGQAMTMSGGNPQIFFGSVITMTLVVMSLISVLMPFILARLKALERYCCCGSGRMRPGEAGSLRPANQYVLFPRSGSCIA
jgi:hypothetical protein